MDNEQFMEKFEQYRQKFGEPFPLMEHLSADDNQVYDMMVECIRENTPADILYPTSADCIY